MHPTEGLPDATASTARHPARHGTRLAHRVPALAGRMGVAGAVGLVMTVAGCAGSGHAPPGAAPPGIVMPAEVGAPSDDPAVTAPTTEGCSASVPLPAWTPPTVARVAVTCPTAQVTDLAWRGVTGVQPAVLGTVVTYELAGEANADTLVPPGQETPEGVAAGTYHPATEVRLVVQPSAIPVDHPRAPVLVARTVRLSSGTEVVVTQAENGYGPLHVTWSDGERTYLLSTTNLWTAAGTSGISAEDAVRMAASVPVAEPVVRG
ncbi:hypothetical protein DNL40_07715 [Xylanimonas oleitrophica]|uniref:Uncharacterized protein n=1 Tax=Xylanimonas oleitrophica TaxID=2607479 RepID=A0A2W5WRY1_9MICO|nr:hypothetical protein [Xylanimonas oleitrophica]PZR53393.1 hypothetical protein DNL40_07715 [Xylanimonas oleitrophica]